MPTQALELRDIHLPDTIGSWPPALGWWLLVLLIPASCFLLYWLYKRITRKTALKTAKKQLKIIQQNTDSNDMQKLIALSALLRRVAMSLSPRQETASLTGTAWLNYLNSTVKETPFTSGVGKVLATSHYQKQVTELNITELISLCSQWLNAQKIK